MTVKDAKIVKNVHPPNINPKLKTITNGNHDLTIAALLTQRPFRKIKIAKFTTFHLPIGSPYPNLLRLFATKEWQLQVNRL